MDSTTIAAFLQNLSFKESREFYFKAFEWTRLKVTDYLEPFAFLIVEDRDFYEKIEQSALQEVCSVRNILNTRALANFLIDDKGDLKASLLGDVILFLEHHLYLLGPLNGNDPKRNEQILRVLRLLKENKSLCSLLKMIGRPFSNRYADQIIRATLQLAETVVITDAHARRAALSAWMCYLRQNVGSCFATAPAILIQNEQPEQFLKDINDLLNTGRLKRTYAGLEYTVPMSVSWGAGDLKKSLALTWDEGELSPPIWKSPALLEALKGVNFFTSKKSSLEHQAHKKIQECLKKSFEKEATFYVSIEEMIKGLLLSFYQISERDLKEYENRPRGMIQTNLLIQTPQMAIKGAGIGQACANYLLGTEIVHNIFKGFSDNALLKAWEFTIASFSENKAGFTRWNLYTSLGLNTQEPGGIGYVLYERIKEKLEEENRLLKEMQEEHEQIYAHIKYLETRMRSASENEAQWLKAEYQTRRNEFYTFEELRNQRQHRASRFANLYNVLVQAYDRFFPQYFQEVYDADMGEVVTGPFDDSPAGFRLIYKHGRNNTAQWTRIKTPNEFVDSLANFFMITENEIASSAELEGLEMDFSEIVTALVLHVRSQTFLETSFERMARAHQVRPIANPLENLSKIEKKPWAYTSGGTMETLVSTYYRREQKPSEASRWVENPMELLVFLVDVIKQIPPNLQQPFTIDREKRILMNSPTHAFLLKPGYDKFRKAWEDDSFTYTFVRDHIVKPMHDFVEDLYLDDRKMAFLIARLSQEVPSNYRHYFLKTFTVIHGSMRSFEFSDYVMEIMFREKGLQRHRYPVLSQDHIARLLYRSLPLIPAQSLVKTGLEILEDFQAKTKLKLNLEMAKEIFGKIHLHLRDDFIASDQLQDYFKGALCLLLEQTAFPLNMHTIVGKIFQKHQLAYPNPLIFADTNWVKDYFAFIVSPANNQLELWRVGESGLEGSPMSMWQQWLNGTRKDIPWSVYHKPYEYSPEVIQRNLFI